MQYTAWLQKASGTEEKKLPLLQSKSFATAFRSPRVKSIMVFVLSLISVWNTDSASDISDQSV